MQADRQGWARPASATKFHYFGSDGRSLCGNWLFATSDLEDDYDDHKDNCAACRKKVITRRAQQAKSAAPLGDVSH